MNSNTYFFIIAGFTFKIIFHLEDRDKNIKSPFIINKILQNYKNFRLLDNKLQKNINFTISFIQRYFKTFRVKTKDKKVIHMIGLYQEKSEFEYVTNYQVSYSHFQLIMKEIIRKLLIKNGFFLHASAVKINNAAIIFTGRSGAGKSTAVRLLRKYYYPLADDNLIIKINGDSTYLYQTPFSEKYKITKKPAKYRVKGICFLKKSNNCKLKQIFDYGEIVKILLREVCMEDMGTKKNVQLLMDFIANCKFFRLSFPKKSKQLKEIFTEFSTHHGMDQYHDIQPTNQPEVVTKES